MLGIVDIANYLWLVKLWNVEKTLLLETSQTSTLSCIQSHYPHFHIKGEGKKIAENGDHYKEF